MEYALIKNSLVENIVVAEAEFAAQIAPEWDAVVMMDTPETVGAKIGGSYVAGVFADPAGPGAPAPPVIPEGVPTVPMPRLISVGAFFDRFGVHKYPILASENVSIKALIQDCAVRKYIDLDNPQLPYGVGMLVSLGFAIDPDAIVNAPITPSERP